MDIKLSIVKGRNMMELLQKFSEELQKGNCEGAPKLIQELDREQSLSGC
jgi:hypothetical protein